MAPKRFPPIDVFRATLHRVEQGSGLAPDDPSLLEVKRILLNRIAELEQTNTEESAPRDEPSAPAAAVVDPVLEPVVESKDVTPLLAQGAPELPNSARTVPLPNR